MKGDRVRVKDLRTDQSILSIFIFFQDIYSRQVDVFLDRHLSQTSSKNLYFSFN
jgi:hypothetical protein